MSYSAYNGQLTTAYATAKKITDSAAFAYSRSHTGPQPEDITAIVPLRWGRSRGMVPTRANGTWGILPEVIP